MAGPLRVLILGGGVAALEATLALRALAEHRVDIELLAPEAEFVYRPMSVAAPFEQGEARRFPLARLVELAGASLTTGSVERLDLDRRRAVTADGAELEWDALLIALGARLREGVAGGLTFRGPQDANAVAELIGDAAAGRLRSLTFAVPTLAAWPLPAYELALMAKIKLENRGATRVQLALVTPEAEPLAVFGRKIAASTKDLLDTRSISLHAHTTPVVFRNGALVVVPGRALRTEQVVSLPVHEGRRIPGLPDDGRGFVRTDTHGRVHGRDDVYAAGDITTFPVKQGGIATQQADAAAESIAALAGAPVTSRPFRPVLRGLLLTGLTPRFMAASLLKDEAEVDSEALWWPPAKIVGHYLSPFLAQHAAMALDR